MIKSKSALLFLYLILILSPCFSKDNIVPPSKETPVNNFLKDLNFSLGTGLSYLNGQYREIVYPGTNSVNPYLSELLWNLDNVLLFNLAANLHWRPWVMNISVSTALTRETGKMTDTDWTNYTNTDRTHWSLSRIWLDNSLILDVGISYNIVDQSGKLTIPFGAGYKLNYWDWEDEVLDFIYPDPQPPDFIGVNGIDYKVIQNIFYFGTGISFKRKSIKTSLSFNISPYINSWDLDHHILRDLYFLDTFTSNFWYRTELSVDYKITENNNISLLLYMEEFPETIGDTYQYSSNPEKGGTQTDYYPDGAGMASLMWGIGISYIRTF